MARNYAKLGIEANQPIEGNGQIAARLRNPDFITTTGAHWLRLNFVLPNADYLDRYDTIVNSFIARDMKIYATVGHDATIDFRVGDMLRDPNSTLAIPWIKAYAKRFLDVVERYQGKIFVYEAFNEPNGWQGGQQSIVHPRWFVYMMNHLYQTIQPRQRGIRLISGPLESTWVNNNEGAEYLNEVYKIGNWAPGEAPWDGVGYHIYVGEDPASPKGSPGSIDLDDIRNTYKSFLNKIWGVINFHDPRTKNLLFISEFGWTSILGEEHQAQRNRLAMEILAEDDRVAMASLFCTEDFYKPFGIYTEGLGHQKQSFHAFRQMMTTRAPQRTSHVDLDALEGPVGGPIVESPDDGESQPWRVGPGIMRHPVDQRVVILLPPFDDGRWGRAVLAAGYHGQGGATLAWSPGEAGLTIAGEERIVLVINPQEWGTPDGSMVPWFRANTPGVKVREEMFLTPDALRDWLRATTNPFANAQ